MFITYDLALKWNFGLWERKMCVFQGKEKTMYLICNSSRTWTLPHNAFLWLSPCMCMSACAGVYIRSGTCTHTPMRRAENSLKVAGLRHRPSWFWGQSFTGLASPRWATGQELLSVTVQGEATCLSPLSSGIPSIFGTVVGFGGHARGSSLYLQGNLWPHGFFVCVLKV